MATPIDAKFAILTPAGASAIAVIGLWGNGALAAAELHVRRRSVVPLASLVGRVLVGHWSISPLNSIDPVNIVEPPPAIAEEELVVAIVSAEEVEISCHGGQSVIKRIVESLLRSGAKLATDEEYRARDAVDRLSMRATELLGECQTSLAARHLLVQSQGKLSAAIREVIAALDERQWSAAAEQLSQLLATASSGMHLIEPFRITIAGRPNVGKSALLNALVGFERAVVFDQPGTTRDVVQSVTAIGGYPVEFSDTAGVRTTLEPIEREGIERSRDAMASCDLLLLVLDQSVPLTADDHTLIEEVIAALDESKLMLILNKCDLPAELHLEGERAWSALGASGAPMQVSAKQLQGIDTLIAAIERRLVPTALVPGEAVVFAKEIAAKLRDAWSLLDREHESSADREASASRARALLEGLLT